MLTRLYKAGPGEGGGLKKAQHNPIEAGKASDNDLGGEINNTPMMQQNT